KLCAMAAAAVGLPASAGRAFAESAMAGAKPSVIWLHFSECTGCTETLLRPSHPGLDELILDLISLDYHETLFVAAGHQFHAAKKAAMAANAGKYVLVVEGAIPTKDGGIYCKIGGQTAVEIINEAAADAGAIIAIGSCASWGGVPSADPNPTGCTGAPMVLDGKTVVTIPGCPPNPYNFLGVVLQYATFGTLPELDGQGRPKFAYGRTIHEHCPRRPHFDAGRFAKVYGDDGHRLGYCLYELGCKGPQTHANCSTLHFNEVNDAWPIGLGHPCFGCTEPAMAFRLPQHATVPIINRTPSMAYAPIRSDQQTRISPVATGIAGFIGGVLTGAGLRIADHLRDGEPAAQANTEV
ncbi:MAG TPA: hydrogenase small subunit, partial [Longimicrobiales bacterium]|nr:hydrogenase small subunit [Longimicrobiales bacterium]